MADKIEPLLDLSIANVFRQLHDTAIDQSKSDLPAGYVVKNLAFADDKTKEMKAGEYLIVVAPEDEKDNTLFLDDKTRPKAEAALTKYVEFFVNKTLGPKDFAEITVDVQDSGDDKKKDDANKKPEEGKGEEGKGKGEEGKGEGKPAGESLRMQMTRNSLLTELFDDYSSSMISEEGEPEGGEAKSSAPKATKKVRGLSVKYTCELSNEKTGSLSKAMKKGAKSLFGGIWNDLTQIKITGGAFGKEGLAVGKVLDPDAWKETLGRPDIDANTVKSDIDAVMQRDYPGNTVFSTVHRCQSLLSDLKKRGIKVPGELAKVLTEVDYCITFKCQKDNDENYDSYSKKTIAEVLNKAIGNYYKSRLTHPVKFTVSENDIFKVEGYSDKNKDINAPKDKQTPNKVKIESVGFLAYCKAPALIAEDGESKSSSESVADKAAKKLLSLVKKHVKTDQLDKNYKPVESDVTYGSISDAIEKVKFLYPENESDISKIEEQAKASGHSSAFVIDLPVRGKEEEGEPKLGLSVASIDARAKYSKLLCLLFEGMVEEAEGELSQLLAEDLTAAVKETISQMSKKAEAPSDYAPIVFNYYKKESAKKESMESSLKLLSFIYEDILDEADKKKTDQKKLARVKELIKDKLSLIRKKYGDDKDAFTKLVYSDQGQQLSWTKGKDAENNHFNEFISLLFSDKPADEVAKKVGAMSSKSNFRNDIIYRFIAPVEKLEDDEEQEQEKVKVRFFDADPKTGEKTGDPLAEIEIAKGAAPNESDEGQDTFRDLDKKLEDEKKDGFTFRGWSPDAGTKLDEDTDLVAKYIEDSKKDEEYTVQFMYPKDPAKEDDVDPVPGDNAEQKVKAGEAAEAPEPPAIDGWKFDGWDNDFSNVKEDMLVIAKYAKAGAKITFTVPEDPSDPDKGTKQLGDPIEFKEGEPVSAPEPPDYSDKGYEFEKWDPDPEADDFKPTEDTTVVGKYKKKEGEKQDGVLHEVYVFIDYADLAKPEGAKTVVLYAPKDPKDSVKDGPVDVGNGKFKKIGSINAEKGKDLSDQLSGKAPDFSKDGYELKGWQPAKVDSGKQPKTLDDVVAAGGGKVAAVYQKKDDDKEQASGENNDLYIYASKKIKYKNEKSVGRKEKKMKNGNAYST